MDTWDIKPNINTLICTCHTWKFPNSIKKYNIPAKVYHFSIFLFCRFYSKTKHCYEPVQLLYAESISIFTSSKHYCVLYTTRFILLQLISIVGKTFSFLRSETAFFLQILVFCAHNSPKCAITSNDFFVLCCKTAVSSCWNLINRRILSFVTLELLILDLRLLSLTMLIFWDLNFRMLQTLIRSRA